MDRAEATGICVAVLGHTVLFGLLSLSLLQKPPLLPHNEPVDVQLVDDVGVVSGQPTPAVEPPAPSFAPEIAPSEVAVPDEPKPVIKPPRPEKTVAAPSSTLAPSPVAAPSRQKPHVSHLATDLALATMSTSASASVAAKASGVRLGDLFKDGASTKTTTNLSTTPKSTAITTQAQTSYRDALTRIVQPCLNEIPYIGPGVGEVHNRIILHLNIDGTLSMAPDVTQTGITDENRPSTARLKELVRRAYQKCAPYQLPPQLYRDTAGRGWNTVPFDYVWRKSS